LKEILEEEINKYENRNRVLYYFSHCVADLLVYGNKIEYQYISTKMDIYYLKIIENFFSTLLEDIVNKNSDNSWSNYLKNINNFFRGCI